MCKCPLNQRKWDNPWITSLMKCGPLSEDKPSGIPNLRITSFIKIFNSPPGSQLHSHLSYWQFSSLLTHCPQQSYPPNCRFFFFLMSRYFCQSHFFHSHTGMELCCYHSSSFANTLPNGVELFLDFCGSTVQHSCIFPSFLPLLDFYSSTRMQKKASSKHKTVK